MGNLELDLFPAIVIPEKQNNSSTFSVNMSLPVHGWFRYTAGFSATWVRNLIQKEKLKGRSRVVDPFAGSGTVLLESEFVGAESIGIEAHSFVYRIANAKLKWKESQKKFIDASVKVLDTARKINITQRDFPKLIEKCYPLETIRKLEALKKAWIETSDDNAIKELNWLVITSILRECSPVGTAQWQYIQPVKSKTKVADPFKAFQAKAQKIYYDMVKTQHIIKLKSSSKIFLEDARNIQSIPEHWADLVITSPPYANNYDYADATRLEMTFWGEIQDWGDLQESVRKFLVRACTQHVSGLNGEVESLLSSKVLKPIRSELNEVYKNLRNERLNHGGKKNYHLMVVAYFKDLADVFHSLRRVTNKNSLMCFVIGDSAPYGIYIPVEEWLGKLAISAGFYSYSFEKLRDRNIKWKNRKHKVPLKEGRLWINS